MENEDPLTEQIISCCYKVHSELGAGFLVVEDKVIVEIKAITGNIPDVFKYQLLSYLKVSHIKVGLLINFGNKSCQVKRVMF